MEPLRQSTAKLGIRTMPLATWSLFAPRALTQPSRAAAQRIITCFRTSRTSRRYKSSATAVATEDGFSEKEEEPIDVANLCQLLKDIPDEDTLANLVRDNPGTWRGVEKQLMESVDANGTCRAMEPTAAQLRLFAFGQLLDPPIPPTQTFPRLSNVAGFCLFWASASSTMPLCCWLVISSMRRFLQSLEYRLLPQQGWETLLAM